VVGGSGAGAREDAGLGGGVLRAVDVIVVALTLPTPTLAPAPTPAVLLLLRTRVGGMRMSG
jgi:hypothetical protein